MWRARALAAPLAATAVAVGVWLTTTLPAQAEDSSGLLASGSVWEDVNAPGIDGDWHMQFRLFSEESGKAGHVKVQVEGRTGPATMRATFDTSVCSGSFGTTAYAVGKLTSGELPYPRFPSKFVGFWAYDAGKRGTDLAWVVPITPERPAKAVCEDPQSVERTEMFVVVGGNVVFKGVARAGTNPIAFTAVTSSGLPDPVAANSSAQVTTPVTSTAPPPPPPTTTPPALGRLRLVGRARTKRVVRLATTLSAPATVATTVDRLLPGRRVRGRCRIGAPAGTRCTLVRRVGVVRQRAAAGAVTLRIPARIRGRVLAPGRYRVRAVATDAAGRRSAPRLLTLRVTR